LIIENWSLIIPFITRSVMWRLFNPVTWN